MLKPQERELIITDLGQSPDSFIPGTIIPDKVESGVLKEQPKVFIPKKMARTLEKPKKPKLKETVGIRLPKHILPRYI